MARTQGRGDRRNRLPSRIASSAVQERRVATPNPELLVLMIGQRYENVHVSPKERASGVLARVAKVMTTPGTDRTRLFQSTSVKPVYAYSIYSKDPTKVVREDVSSR